MTRVVIALGSNLGGRVANVQAGARLLREAGVTPLRTSSVWETPPMPADQPAFLNAVLLAEGEQPPMELLRALKAIERQLGRRPERRWGPRPIDLDLLFYGEERVDSAELTVPHPGIAERAFVLAPLAEVWAEPLPVLGERAIELLARVDTEGLRRTGWELLPR